VVGKKGLTSEIFFKLVNKNAIKHPNYRLLKICQKPHGSQLLLRIYEFMMFSSQEFEIKKVFQFLQSYLYQISQSVAGTGS
jgi:hypothetical protein